MLAPSAILVVEDAPHMQDLIKEILTENRMQVYLSSSGEECLNFLQAQTVDLALLDMHLPDIIGIELFKQIQQMRPGLPCIFVTAEGSETEVVLGLELGARDYIIKPFRAREFLARIKNVLKQTSHTTLSSPPQQESAPQPFSEEVLRQGVLELNLNRREAKLLEHPLEFTRTEFDLLELLMRHPHQVLSRQQILDHVWRDDLEVSERIVDSHIRHLRSKLSHYDFIHTVRGVGYSFKPPDA